MKSLRIIYCTVLAATLAGFALRTAQAQGSVAEDKPYFPDVPREHWAYNAVQRLVRAGIIEGYPGGTENQVRQPIVQTRQETVASPEAVAQARKTFLMAVMYKGFSAALKGVLINVNATTDRVTLTGTVQNLTQKKLAGAIATQKAPAHTIINQLKVVGPSQH